MKNKITYIIQIRKNFTFSDKIRCIQSIQRGSSFWTSFDKIGNSKFTYRS